MNTCHSPQTNWASRQRQTETNDRSGTVETRGAMSCVFDDHSDKGDLESGRRRAKDTIASFNGMAGAAESDSQCSQAVAPLASHPPRFRVAGAASLQLGITTKGDARDRLAIRAHCEHPK